MSCILGYCYDAAGNLLDDGACPAPGAAHKYAYDGEGRLVSVGYGQTVYTYDAEGNRVGATAADGTVTNTVFDDLTHRPVAHYVNHDAAGQNQDLWWNGEHLGSLVQDGRGGLSISWSATDWLGSERLRTDGAGKRVGLYTSLPFGEGLTTLDGVDTDQVHFTGKERDAESGLDYFGARYYASTMGRFASADPYEIVIRKNQGKSANQQKQLFESFIANPQAWNKYAYGLNNPLKNVDVGGNCSVPAGLQGGQTGVCVEAFIAAPRIGGVGLGDNRTFNSNGGSYRFRVDVRVDPGPSGGVSVNRDARFSKVGSEGVNFGRRGTGYVTLGPVTTDDSGNRHFEVTGIVQNGFEAVNNLGTISFDLNFTATPDGAVTLDKAMGTTFPSIEAYSYNSSGQVTGTLLNSPERQSGDLKKPQQCIGGSQCPQ